MPAHASTCVLLVSQRQDELEALRAVAETDWHGLRAVTDVRESCALLRAEEIAVVVARLDEPGADALTLLRPPRAGTTLTSWYRRAPTAWRPPSSSPWSAGQNLRSAAGSCSRWQRRWRLRAVRRACRRSWTAGVIC